MARLRPRSRRSRPPQLDLTLRKTQDLASQLSNGEWFMSWPGSVEMKNGLLNCTQCHGLNLIARSRYTGAGVARRPRPHGPLFAGQRAGRAPAAARHARRASPILAQSMAGREGEPPVRAELDREDR